MQYTAKKEQKMLERTSEKHEFNVPSEREGIYISADEEEVEPISEEAVSK